MKPSPYNTLVNPGNIAPLCGALFLSFILYNYITSNIPVLGFPVRPPTIFFIVVSLIIYPIKNHVLWTFAHIKEKCLKLVPSFAYLNSSTTIIFPSGVISIGTSIEHMHPRSVCFSFGHSMLGNSFYKLLGPITTTGFCLSVSEAIREYGSVVSTFTDTFKCYSSMFVFKKTNNRPPIKTFTDVFIWVNFFHLKVIHQPRGFVNV